MVRKPSEAPVQFLFPCNDIFLPLYCEPRLFVLPLSLNLAFRAVYMVIAGPFVANPTNALLRNE